VLESPLPDVLKSPGSVARHWLDDDVVEILVCNNFVHTVSRHRLSKRRGWAAVSSEKLYAAGLDVPDSIAITPGATHVAVSNHNKHRVDVYGGAPASRRPWAKLAGCEYPHGVRFTSDGRCLLLADAGSPMVHIYRADESGWRGWRQPAASVEVMPPEAFERGRNARGEGGAKGIDLTADNRVMVVSCEHQHIAFFDCGSLLDRLASEDVRSPRYRPGIYERAIDLAPASLMHSRRARSIARRIADWRFAFRTRRASA
jgi:hypothetical protein